MKLGAKIESQSWEPKLKTQIKDQNIGADLLSLVSEIT